MTALPARSVGSLGLAVVARDEEGVLGPCLASAIAAVDEIVVIDTGSRDGTPGIARRFGARLYRHPYPGDQAAAFNLLLRRVRTDWVLVLDADEVLDAASAVRIRTLIGRSGGLDGWFCEQRNYSYAPILLRTPCDPLDPRTWGAAGYMAARSVRLFRRKPGLCYRGRVHQGVHAAILARGGRLADADIVIHHQGWLRPGRVRDKLPRYLALAQAEVRDRPDEARSWIELAALLQETGEAAAAREAACRARALGYGAGSDFHAGLADLELGHHARALRAFTRALRMVGHRCVDFDFAVVDVQTACALALRALGRRGQAVRALRRAVALAPSHPQAANNLGAVLSEQGRLAEAEAVLRDLLDRHPGHDMAWATLGANLLRRGLTAASRWAFERALDIDPGNAPARLNLGRLLARIGRRRRAAEVIRPVAIAWRPRDAVDREVAAHLPKTRRIPAAPHVVACDGGIVVLTPRLDGEAGQILVRLLLALGPRPTRVLCGLVDTLVGRALCRTLADAGIPVATAAGGPELGTVVARSRAAWVIQQWWPDPWSDGLRRQGPQCWAVLAHAPLPAPAGHDACVVPSTFVGQYQARSGSGPVLVAPPPAEELFTIPRARRVRGPLRVLMVQELDPGFFPRRLPAFLPDLHGRNAGLAVVGRGARRWEIEHDLAGSSHARSVRFLGPRTPAGAARLFAQAHVGLHLVESDEPVAGLAVRDMMAAGLPVVAQPRGCLPEIVEHGLTGYLEVEEAAIARRLAELLDSPSRRAAMGRAARARAAAWRAAESLRPWRRLFGTTLRGSAIDSRSAARIP